MRKNEAIGGIINHEKIQTIILTYDIEDNRLLVETEEVKRFIEELSKRNKETLGKAEERLLQCLTLMVLGTAKTMQKDNKYGNNEK